jgi:hypothetical protein
MHAVQMLANLGLYVPVRSHHLTKLITRITDANANCIIHFILITNMNANDNRNNITCFRRIGCRAHACMVGNRMRKASLKGDMHPGPCL